jgi:hypothetical protein
LARPPGHATLSTEPAPPRPFDWVGALIATVTVMALGWVVWQRFGPPSRPEPPGLGAKSPPLRLIDPVTLEPIVLLGLRGKLVWLTFWSVDSPSARSDLGALERVWKRFKERERFAMAAVAVESGSSDRLRAALTASHATLPAYLASPATSRAFGAEGTDLPLHFLIDETGRVAAVSRGGGPSLDRLADKAETWLDELQPFAKTRFAGVKVPDGRALKP